jgi:hypothetical protein
MRVRLRLLAALVLFAAGAVRADDTPKSATPADDWTAVEVVPLRKAAAAKIVSAVGEEPHSYTGVTLKLTNATKTRVAVELSGSYLGPRSPGSCQRLALGPPVDVAATIRSAGGSSVARLEPGETRAIVLNTCCMDAGLPAPSKQRFDVASDAMPAVREKVMRWWVDNPTASQNAVNCAIWSNSPDVHVAPGTVESYASPKGRFAALHGGVYYRLDDGVLTSVDADGLERVYGAEVFQALPTDGGLYAVMLGDDHAPKLWRLETTGESRWSKVLDLEGTDRVRALFDAGKSGFVVVTDKHVMLRGGRTQATIPPTNERAFDDPSVRVDAEGRLLVVMHQVPRAPVFQGGAMQTEQDNVFGLFSLDPSSARVELLRRCWEVSAASAGPGGTFALTPTEHRLRRLAGEKFAPFGAPSEAYVRILGSSPESLWLVDEGGKIVVVDAKTGHVRVRTSVAADEKTAYCVDPKTGDLGYVRGTDFVKVRATDGAEETVAPK